MTFERTVSGQSNRALFFRCDLVCYVEGNSGQDYCVDIAFWSAVFEALAPNKRIHFSSRGGKPEVEALALDIINRGITDTIAAMDRDYSEFRKGRYIDDSRVFYTYGYSWENDVYSVPVIERIAMKASRGALLPPDQADALSDDQNRLTRAASKVVFADFVAILKGGSVLDRQKPGRYFERNDNGRPDICRERCKHDIRRARQVLAGRAMRPSIGFPRNGARYLWGKAFEHYIHMGLVVTIRSLCGRTIGNEHLRDLAISCFGQCLASGQNFPVLDYYRNKWADFAAM